MAEVVLTVVYNELEAGEICGLLGVNDIRSMYRRGSSAMDLGGSMRGPFEIVVDETDLERAQELLDAPPPPDEGDPEP